MKRTGSAIWNGGLKDGQGTISTESGVLDGVSYSFSRRFGEEKGTNPEELIGAAHAACYSMALSMILGQNGMDPEEIATRAEVSIEQVEGGFAINRIHLHTRARIPGADPAAFNRCADEAKAGCPVSKLLTGAEITLDAALEG